MGGTNGPHPYRPQPVLTRAHTTARPPFVATLATVLALVLTACSSTVQPEEDDPSAEPLSREQPNEPDEPDPSSDEASGDEPPAGDEELAAIWEAFHSAWIEQAASEDPDAAAFEDVAVDPASVVEVLVAQRGDARLVTTEAELWPTFDIGDDAADVRDCVIVAQHPADQPDSTATVTVGWEADAVLTDDGWRIATAAPTGLFCIAEELNSQLLDAYRDFRAAKEAAWDPPDPEHPDLERTMAGEQLEFVRQLLTEHARDGIVIREPAPTDNAVVLDVGIGHATVSDCTEQVEGYGAFDLASGERLDDLIAPVESGRLDAQSVELLRQADGDWVVVDQAATRDTDCVIGSTRYEVS